VESGELSQKSTAPRGSPRLRVGLPFRRWDPQAGLRLGVFQRSDFFGLTQLFQQPVAIVGGDVDR
jgi:hypothetical protein